MLRDMRFLAVAIMILAIGAVPGAGRADEREDIVAVIQAQLQAFQADDGITAFSYASPGIRQIFQTPERFMQMVRGGYRPVYRPQKVDFLDLVPTNAGPVQRVLLIGPAGRTFVALYTMEKQPNGTWLIDGCTLVEPPASSV